MIFSFNITLHCIEKIKSNKFEEYTKLDEKIGVEDYIEKFKKLDIKNIFIRIKWLLHIKIRTKGETK